MKKKCPDEQTLSGYAQGYLGTKDRDRLTSHLADCDECVEIISLLKAGFERTDEKSILPVPESVTNRALQTAESMARSPFSSLKDRAGRVVEGAKTWMSTIVPQSFGEPDLVPVRGDEINGENEEKQIDRIEKRFDNLVARIEIAQTHIATKNALIRVFLSGDVPDGVRVSLNRDKRELASFLSCDAGIIFEDIPDGNFNLRFSVKGRDLGIFEFTIPYIDIPDHNTGENPDESE